MCAQYPNLVAYSARCLQPREGDLLLAVCSSGGSLVAPLTCGLHTDLGLNDRGLSITLLLAGVLQLRSDGVQRIFHLRFLCTGLGSRLAQKAAASRDHVRAIVVYQRVHAQNTCTCLMSSYTSDALFAGTSCKPVRVSTWALVHIHSIVITTYTYTYCQANYVTQNFRTTRHDCGCKPVSIAPHAVCPTWTTPREATGVATVQHHLQDAPPPLSLPRRRWICGGLQMVSLPSCKLAQGAQLELGALPGQLLLLALQLDLLCLHSTPTASIW
jgi:hypothetical protein